jgi:hypothetical protein
MNIFSLDVGTVPPVVLFLFLFLLKKIFYHDIMLTKLVKYMYMYQLKELETVSNIY